MSDDTSLTVAPVRAEDPKKKKDEEKDKNVDGPSKEDASKDTAKEGEELVCFVILTLHALFQYGFIVRRRSATEGRARNACRASQGLP